MPSIFGRAIEPEAFVPAKRPNGTPGVQAPEVMEPEAAAQLLTRSAAQKVIGKEEIAKAATILEEYKNGKANLETRVVDDEMWWELRHWDAIRGKQREGKKDRNEPEPTSAWLFNSILNKHADAMDNYPEPVVLPREQSDQKSAEILSSVLPVVMEYNEFEQVYSDNWWEKLKHGTAAYGVFWNTQKENGLGDIDIRGIDLLKIFWEPGVMDIQKSRNLFIVDLVDNDLLNQQYQEYDGKLKGNTIDVTQYVYDDTVDTSDKSVVVDWYYKRQAPDGRTILHYAKFVGDTLLYASENEPEYQQRGFYDHGLYPVVFDCLFPEKGTPVGFGYVAIAKDPQLYIDKLSANILESSMMNTKKRFFMSSSTNVNREQLLDWNNPIVDVEGELTDTRLKEITCQPLSDIYLNVVNMKIEEMKDTAANRDVNSGGYGSGVTAAAAIAALQEAGNKASRDMISAAYRAYINIAELVIELMRQFYDEARAFRIMAPNGTGEYSFVNLDNSRIRDQVIGVDANGVEMFRRPVFDLKIKAQKKNPFSRMEQNERALQMYQLGFFNPERAQEASMAVGLMEFEGVDKVREQIAQGQTLFNVCQQLKQENDALKVIASMATGRDLTGGAAPNAAGSPGGGGAAPAPAPAPDNASGELARAAKAARAPMTDYGRRLAARSTPNMNAKSNAANPER